MVLLFYINLSEYLDDRVCKPSDDDTNEGIYNGISGLLHLLIISCREDELDASPRDRHDSKYTSQEYEILNNGRNGGPWSDKGICIWK